MLEEEVRSFRASVEEGITIQNQTISQIVDRLESLTLMVKSVADAIESSRSAVPESAQPVKEPAKKPKKKVAKKVAAKKEPKADPVPTPAPVSSVTADEVKTLMMKLIRANQSKAVAEMLADVVGGQGELDKLKQGDPKLVKLESMCNDLLQD